MLNFTYSTEIIQPKPGIYQLVGTMPAYMQRLIFLSLATAQEAKAEAIRVLETGTEPLDGSKFTRAYLAGIREIA